VGDKSTDPVRVNADELRADVVVEGGNLGLTQAARVEYARRGGRINTDALDNSAGVDCSDHEVNIKIALSQLEASGYLEGAGRDELLHDLEPDVRELVLANNVEHNATLGVSRRNAVALNDVYARQVAALHDATSRDCPPQRSLPR
jgi:glutamate dehydrogenase